MNWSALLFVLLAALAAWFAYRTIKGNPQMFSRANISKSITTLGVLALLLIVVIGFCVLMLK